MAGNAVTAAPIYSLTDLGVMPGFNYSEGIDVNNAGQVAVRGWASGHFTGFVWQGGNPTLVDLPYQYSQPLGISEAGDVYGYASQGPTDSEGFVWRAGTYELLGHASGGQDWTRPADMNASGTIVGYSLGDPLNTSQVFLYENRVFYPLGVLPVGFPGTDPSVSRLNSEATGINDHGVIVGYTQSVSNQPGVPDHRAWALQNGTAIVLDGPFDGVDYSRALGINNEGTIFGWALDSTNKTHAVVWRDHNPEVLQSLPDASYVTPPADINSEDWVVGAMRLAMDGGTTEVAVVWDAEGIAYNLNELLDETGEGWTLQKANGINDRGWIVGLATNPLGESRGFLLMPPGTDVPEPQTAALLLSAMIGAGYLGRRRG
ncbi:hypothetical protein [Aeoliella mucimassa]|nr:hypothetical protein [Aeoliella mucimassa]